MTISKLVIAFMVIAFPLAGNAVVLVQTSDAGWYNDSIGTTLNLSNGTGADDSTAYFPIFNDSSVNFLAAPDLTAASGVLGNWLSDPLNTANTSAEWAYEASIPNTWTPGTEVAVMYQFDTLGATNVVASLGVDNGIFAWLNGEYLFGARGPGHAVNGEYVLNLGNLTAGTHFLQLLLEDHGGANAYNVNITADAFIPAPVPAPAALALLLMGLLGMSIRGRRS